MPTRTLVFAAMCLALAGCGASASISSARDPSAAGHFSRVYVAVEPGNAEPEFAKTLCDAIGAELQHHGVVVKTQVLTGLDLDANAIDRDVKAWRPDGVLMTDFAGGSGTSAGFDTLRFDVSLIAVASNRRIWRAQVHAKKGGVGTDDGVAEETAESVATRLEQDGLIGSRK